MAIATIFRRFVTLSIGRLMTTGDTHLTFLFIAMSRPHPECLPVRLSTAMWDTLGYGITFETQDRRLA